jgi:hypothetical protein
METAAESLAHYNGPATVEWTQDDARQVAAVRCIAEARTGEWRGRLVEFPSRLHHAWSSVEALTLQLPDQQTAAIRPTRISSDLVTPLELGFQGVDAPPL